MTSKRTLRTILALLVVGALALTACGPKNAGTAPNPDTSGKGQTTAAKKPAVGGELNLRLEKDPDNFNPILSSTTYGSQVYAQVYDTLFEFNTKWEATPHLAQSWKYDADQLGLTINLRQGVKFHDGAELTADDVVFTLMTLKHPDYVGARKSSMNPVKEVVAKDKYTVYVKLNEPFAPLLNNINYGIMQKKLFDGTEVKNFDKHPVTLKPIGTGPYKFKEYVVGQYVLLDRNPDWFKSKETGGAPFIQTLRYKVIPDDQTGLAALENGETDLENPEPADVARLLADYKGKLVPVNYERNGFGFIQFNVTRPHLDNKLVRQALTYGLDRKAIIDGVMDGRAVIPPGPIPPVSWAYDSSIKAFPYDPALAKKLLEQAGYKLGTGGIYEKDGKPLKLVFYASSGSPLIEGIASVARKNWKDIGVDLDVQLMDFNAMLDNYLKPGKFDVGFSGMTLSLDPDSQFNLFHSSIGKPDAKGNVNGFNRGRYDNAKVDQLLEAGRKESDPAKRKQFYSDFQKQIADDAPVILVYANQYTDFHSSRIKGVVNFPGRGCINLDYLYLWYINEQ